MYQFLNTTMDYIRLYLQYSQWEGSELVNAPISWMNWLKLWFLKGQPVFNVSCESMFIYFVILMSKNLIVFYGMMDILPLKISVTCFPILLLYHHFFITLEEPVAASFTVLHFMVIWTLLWQFPFFRLPSYYLVFFVLLSIALASVEWKYIGLQFAVDVFIVLISVWLTIRSALTRQFDITFLILSCFLYYVNLDRGPTIVEAFYSYVFFMCVGLYGAYVASLGHYDEMVFFIPISSGFIIYMCYYVAAYGFSGPDYAQAGKEPPFNRLPDFNEFPFRSLKSPDDEIWTNETNGD